MRTLPLTCKDPAAWLHDYKANGMPTAELFTCLTACAVTADPADVAKAVPDELKDEYRDLIQGSTVFKTEEELVFVNSPRTFGLRELRVMREWYLNHPGE